MRRKVLAALAVSLVLVGAAEGSARILEPALSSSGTWPEGGWAERYDRVARQAERGGTDVVFAGSSMVGEALDDPTFARITGLQSLNVNLPGSTNMVLEPWLVDIVLPMLDPKVVVIGVASRDFNDNGKGPEVARQTLLTAPGYQRVVADDWLTDIDRAASSLSTLVRVRRQIREPTNILDAIERRPVGVQPIRCPRSADKERYVRSPIVDAYAKSVLYRYDAGGSQQQALIDTIEALEERGVQVILLEVASYERDYVRVHPRGRTDLETYRESLNDVVEATGVRSIDATDFKEQRYFRDAIHTNCAGRIAVTTAIAETWGEITDGSARRVVLVPPSR